MSSACQGTGSSGTLVGGSAGSCRHTLRTRVRSTLPQCPLWVSPARVTRLCRAVRAELSHGELRLQQCWLSSRLSVPLLLISRGSDSREIRQACTNTEWVIYLLVPPVIPPKTLCVYSLGSAKLSPFLKPKQPEEDTWHFCRCLSLPLCKA